MDLNLLRNLLTAIAMASFIGIVIWAYSPARKDRFERDGLLPFDDADGFGSERRQTDQR
jgi:cytochrome c oxidase cbb3-type subunit 4